ncbi:MAG TPA: hypothetical protein VLI90_11900 [Tepidisphaeraceae bacterium]|nr:hypothetical protein [Tepidisphaeraceae bacterium]
MQAVIENRTSALIADRDDRALDRRIAVALFIIATVIATLFVQIRGEFEKLGEEPRVGIHVSLGHGFRTPLDLSPDAEISAWMPPIYPIVSGTAFRLFGGPGPLAFRLLMEINAICYGLMVAGTFVMARLLLSRPAGVLAAVFVICHPMFLMLVHRFWHTYLAQAGMIWLIVAALRTQRSGPTFLRLALIGAGLGILVQMNGSFILVAPIIVWLAVRDLPIARWFPFMAASAITFILMLVPWTVRNYVQFHQLTYVRRGAELEMWLGNLPGSNGWQDLRFHPTVYLPEHQKMLEMGEANYFAYCKERFLENYHRAPMEYWKRCARRALYLVIGEPNSRPMEWKHASAWFGQLRLIMDVLIFSLGTAGLIAAWRLGYRTAWVVPFSIASTVPYLISHMNYRFSMHIKLLLLMMIAFLIWSIWQRRVMGAWPRRDVVVNA